MHCFRDSSFKYFKKNDKEFKFETRHVSTVPLSSSVNTEYKVLQVPALIFLCNLKLSAKVRNTCDFLMNIYRDFSFDFFVQ